MAVKNKNAKQRIPTDEVYISINCLPRLETNLRESSVVGNANANANKKADNLADNI